MRCAIAYHSTTEFVRLVQICQLDHTIWAFLKPMQESGSPMPRSVLVQRCSADKVLHLAPAVRAASGGELDHHLIMQDALVL